MTTKAVKTLDKNFHISLKLNDLPISVAVGLSKTAVLMRSPNCMKAGKVVGFTKKASAVIDMGEEKRCFSDFPTGKLLWARTACNANPTGSHYQKLTALKLLSVFVQYRRELFDFGLESRSRKSKENDPSMGKLLVKDQLAEVPISDDEHPRFFPGDGQDILIGKTRRIIAGDSGNIMAKLTKVGNQSKVSALVEEKFHRAASERAPFGGFGETSLPITISFA